MFTESAWFCSKCGCRCEGSTRRCDCKSDEFLLDVELVRVWASEEAVEKINALDYIAFADQMN